MMHTTIYFIMAASKMLANYGEIVKMIKDQSGQGIVIPAFR